jgi:PAS domain S-box-containing protein
MPRQVDPAPTRSPLFLYTVAVLAVIAATALRLLLQPWLGERFPFVIHFVALTSVALYAGIGPALLALILSWLAVLYLIAHPRGLTDIRWFQDQVGFGAFLVAGLAICFVGGAVRAARRRAEAAMQDLQRNRDDFQTSVESQVQERTAELRKSEERFRLLVEGTRDYAIFMLDPQGRITSWNAGAERIKGYRAEEIIGRHFSCFYPREDIEFGKPARELEIATEHGKYEEESWRLRKDGSRFWANVLITALFDEAGQLRGFGKVTKDLTERKEAEENARRLIAEQAARQEAEKNAEVINAQREQLRITLESIGDAVITTDARGNIALLNPAAQALTGWHQHEAAGQPLDAVFAIHNEQTGQRAENPVARVLREGLVVGLANHTVLTARDGTRRPIDDSAAPIKDSHGNILGCVLVFHDVTDKRKAESALQQSAQENARLYRQVREAEQRKDEFLAMLSHELRNPLAPIRNALQVLRMVEPDGQRRQWAMEIMDRQLQYLVRLVDDLLDISRILRGRVELRMEPAELASVIARAIETAHPVLDAHGHQLHTRLPAEPIWLSADPIRLAQVIANLLNNAAKYTSKAGQVWLMAERRDQEVEIRVRDTGIGIAPELLPQVFDLFVQADRSIERSQGGLGIGLTLVKKLVEMHGGSVSARSEGRGQGSEFTVRLPILAEKPAAYAHTVVSGTLASAAPLRRVLVVDDNVDAAESMALLLRMRRHEVRVVHDGPSAIQAASDFQPEVVLLDIGLPGMSGYEVARKLRQAPGGRKLILAAMTGYGQEEDRRRSQEAGFDQHFTKPVDPEQVEVLLT